MDTAPRKRYRILLIGDDCIDEYQYGTIDRISPEAPVPVLRLGHSRTSPGMAANVRANLERLGCDVTYLHGDTSRKTRLIDDRSQQHIVRIDDDRVGPPISIQDLPSDLDHFDALVISDYDKGTVDYGLLQHLRDHFSGAIFVDTKKTDLARIEGCIVKINRSERERVRSLCTDLVVTLGAEGACYQDQHFAAKAIEIVDVCGAGDTFLAALCYQYLGCQDMHQSIRFALRASAVTVQHPGVYAPSPEEIV